MADPGIAVSIPDSWGLGLMALIAVIVICRTIIKLKDRDL